MFKSKQGAVQVCDTACRASAIREAALFRAAQHGPRI
jgi:hypothetical protein